ncbi:hypothetical protein A2707_02630 [Candidatus Saccharibacteria bacterium RIFCSPHIGHO2_01_FULL_45_15]|nr:MAG: hypothetical protein A2707_02630 [Candidatus Saccharibacteria bacterium RIFCSPHIGHO2_01_FULL_45_15]OGL27833.1 MAG: hypothetical protein A3C39_05015 [Candidatus Saccharibacteria bacterium RIFCSPHIGHO2_02_FULL_46_12]OGL31825.1 MAG: hypothetical protein A3E76_03225 [Candidatus Saccharibacteria bacterium RIFCSPHIGHO2_12_FULL_44_22]
MPAKKDTNKKPELSDDKDRSSDVEIKKTSESKKAIDSSTIPDDKDTDLTPQLEVSSKDEIDLMALSEIESTEVGADGKVEESVDPDKELVIPTVPRVVKKPWWQHRKVYIPAASIVLVIVLLAIPQVRFFALGWAWHTTAHVAVTDTASGMPVTDATVVIDSVTATTNESGIASLSGVSLGVHTAVIQKENYKPVSQKVTVDVLPLNHSQSIVLEATGRLVEVDIKNRLTDQAITDVIITNGDSVTYARSDKAGKASVVVPAATKELKAVLSAPGYRVQEVTVTDAIKSFALIPDGSLYFLSKQSGKIDVVKTALDGSDRRVVVAGTGDENSETTSLLTSRDWKFAMLKAKRAPNKPEALYLVRSDNDSYKVIDEGETDFTPIGWIGHSFVYQAQRKNADYWRAKTTAIKSYNADTGVITTIDENGSDPGSTAQSALYNILSNYAITDGLLTYTTTWYAPLATTLTTADKQTTIITTKADGTDKKVVRSFSIDQVAQLSSRLYLPQEVRYQVVPKTSESNQKPKYGELKAGVYKDSDVSFDSFGSDVYPTYLMSPNGNASFWSEERDGKNALFVGGKNADSKEEIASKSEYVAYGWLTDDWLLLQKGGSELYITTKDQLKAGGTPLKVSDYHKLKNSFLGYGYGYGGQ